MALAAHGHALKATWHGIETQRHYEELVGAPPASPGSAFGNTVRVTGTTDIKLNGAEHHAAAADDHDKAAQHHRQAAEHFVGNDYAKAAQEAQIANGYAEQSIFHDDEAAEYHVEYCGGGRQC